MMRSKPAQELKVRPLGELLLRPPRYGLNAAAVEIGADTPTYIRITDIDSDGGFSPRPRVGVRHPDSAAYVLHPGELVFARTGASVGKCYLYDPRDGELVYAGFLINIAPNPRVLNPAYLSLVAKSHAYWRWVAQTSMRSGQPGINGREFARLPIPLPDLAVQEAIAANLADVYRFAETLGSLIAKKQALKQGMMQSLMSGSVRLPSFTQTWSCVTLADLGRTYSGLAGKSKGDFGRGSARFITFLDVINHVRLLGKNLEPVQVAAIERQNQVRRGDVLFNGSSETPEDVALSAAVAFDPSPGTYLNSFCFGFRIDRVDRMDPSFLAYFFRSNVGRQAVYVLAQGATRYNVAKSKFLQLGPLLPPIDEQRAIASVLQEVDAEIGTLRDRLDSVRAVGDGIRQQLLGGRTRLPGGGDAS